METAKNQITLGDLSVGSRLLVRSKAEWRFAAVSKYRDNRVVITVLSPSGRNYRLRREIDSKVSYDGTVAILTSDEDDNWHENFSQYDVRW